VKALSLKQPWLSWIIQGRKTIETRTWRTNYRGPVLLCSSLTQGWGAWALHSSDVDDMEPRGFALAVVDLMDCRPMAEADEKAAMIQWDDRRFAWMLDNVRPILPVPVKGSLGLFEVNVPTIFTGAKS
jgi:hypothetical protein